MGSLFSRAPDSEKIAGYEVYALDNTPNERPETEILEDRGH